LGAEVLVLVTCTNRKTVAPASALSLRALRGNTPAVRARSWVDRLQKNTCQRYLAKELYAGDHWCVARSIEEDAGQAKRRVTLWVCSAGYGLIPCNASIASYAATFAPNHPDSVTRAGDNGHAETPRRDWWDALAGWQGPVPGAPRSIHQLAREHSKSTFLVAASTHYLDAVADDVKNAAAVLGSERLAIFCAGVHSHATLGDYLVPCDARLQATLSGALNSLNIRCVRHALGRSDSDGLELSALKKMFSRLPRVRPKPEAHASRKLSDKDVHAFIRDALKKDPSIRPTPLLRLLRASGRACEQSRFSQLFRRAEGGRHA
jgi:hypothetical protein